MDWQQVASLSIVAVTAILLVRHEVTRRRRAKVRACGGDCECSSSTAVERLKSQVLQESVEEIVVSK
ncbi:MAG: hypothetical protein HW412_486 [Bacteroidetes bacterium]|nr:hypothetical protein [Bacteroidota bacterium]